MLTNAQAMTIKTAILADATQANNVTIQDYSAIADWLNTAGAFIVWRTNVPVEEYREAIVWTEVDNATMTVGKARIWEWLTANMTLPINAAKTNVRQGLADCWASNTTTRTNLLAAAKRTATKAEQLLATGTGSSASPGTLTWEGQISVYDIGGILSTA